MIRAIAVLLATTGLAFGGEFEVTNKVAPKFIVENRLAPASHLPTDPSTPAPVGYQWVKRGDGPWKLEKLTTAASAVAAPTFRDPSHTCARCGREQRTVESFLPNGTHSHRCDGCGFTWTH